MTGIEYGVAGLPKRDWGAERPPRGMYTHYRGGYYYGIAFAHGAATVTLVQSQLIATPWYFPEERTIDRIGVLAIALASSSLRLGMYADLDGLPGALIVDAGNVSGTSTAAVEATCYATVGPGVVWVAIAAQGAGSTVRGITAVGRLNIPSTSLNNSMSAVAGSVRRVTQDVTGELPGWFAEGVPGVTEKDGAVFMAVRVAL